MRYVRFPDDASNAPYAASAGDFAGIIDQLIEKKVGSDRDRAQATFETVYQVFKGTSFLPPSRFQMAEGEQDDAAVLIKEMEKVFEKLAQEVDLAEHFKRVSKHPIYPNCAYYESSNSLALDAKCNPNDIYHWDWLTDEDEFDLQNCIPWWAPRCVIGHLYIPFRSSCLHLPQQGIADLKKACGGEVTKDTWRTDYSELLQPFLAPECVRPRTVFHRLPLLLIALPRPNRLVPCLYAAIGHPTGFQRKRPWQLSDDDPIMPCFVSKIGDQIDDDDVFFHDVCDEDYRTFYVSTPLPDVIVIGSGIDDGLWEFTPDVCLADSTDEIPEWLQPHPVQKFLKLSLDSDTAQLFALTQRRFAGRRWDSDNETVFRPALPDSFAQTRLRQNTIGAYLLRNFPNADGIFEALKNDALHKATAAKEVIDGELSKSQDALDKRFGK